MTKRQLINKLGRLFPKRLRHGKDPIGLQTGKLDGDVKTVLLCLDFDEIVYDKILLMHNIPDLIITHHPFIYGTKHKVFKFDLLKKELCEKVDDLNIPIYSMHTNFDTGKNGMNDTLAEMIRLNNIRVPLFSPMARVGELSEPMDIKQFAYYVKEKLSVKGGYLINEGTKSITSVCIIGGGGWYHYKQSQEEGYDIYISGDMPHHGRRGVIAHRYNYLDLPHEIENVFMNKMKDIILSIDSNINVIAIQHEVEPEVL